MDFILADLTAAAPIYIQNIDGVDKMFGIYHITSKIEQCPYNGKFQQVDYNITLELPIDKLPPEIQVLLPGIAQHWISTQYPNT